MRYTLQGSGTFSGAFEGKGDVRLVYDTYDVGTAIQIEPPRE